MFTLAFVSIVSGMDHGWADWITSEIEVKIKDSHDDSNLIYQIGVIRNISVRVTVAVMFIVKCYRISCINHINK